METIDGSEDYKSEEKQHTTDEGLPVDENDIQGQRTIDTSLEQSAEKENYSKVNFIYREGNPFMDSLVDGLKGAGLQVETHIIPVSTDRLLLSSPRLLKEKGIVGEIDDGVVVTDITMSTVASRIAKEKGLSLLNAYEALDTEKQFKTIEDIQNAYKSVLDQIKEAGKIPIALESNLEDHEYGMFKDIANAESEQPEGQSESGLNDKPVNISHISDILKSLDIPIISKSQWEKYSAKPAEIKKVLAEMGLNYQDVVLLVDHHVGNNGFLKDVPVVFACPCCAGFDGNERMVQYQSVIGQEYNIFPLEYKAQKDNTAISLMELLKKKDIAKEL